MCEQTDRWMDISSQITSLCSSLSVCHTASHQWHGHEPKVPHLYRCSVLEAIVFESIALNWCNKGKANNCHKKHSSLFLQRVQKSFDLDLSIFCVQIGVRKVLISWAKFVSIGEFKCANVIFENSASHLGFRCMRKLDTEVLNFLDQVDEVDYVSHCS